MVEKILDAIGDNNELLKEVLTVKNEDVKRLLRLAAIYGKADVVKKTLDAIGNNKELLKEVLRAIMEKTLRAIIKTLRVIMETQRFILQFCQAMQMWLARF